MTRLQFQPDVRLRSSSDYQGVFNEAQFKVHQPHFLLLANPSHTPLSRVGIIVAKKKIKRAHERNRLKRLSRESFRLYQHQLPQLDIVVMPKVGADLVSNIELHQQLKQAWSRLRYLHLKQTNQSPVVPS